MVLTEDATNFAEQMGIQLFETSAKENINVEEVSLLVLEANYVHPILSSAVFFFSFSFICPLFPLLLPLILLPTSFHTLAPQCVLSSSPCLIP